ncbi:MAG TPA: twin-arginine translocase subunit TatC [Anaerolineaceae bacterium]|nr:twin-arginine translocase subunit TatC [Anaerolineaceae bacterium]
MAKKEEIPDEMSVLGHINELRTRLLVCIIALLVTTMISFAFSQQLAEILAKPIGGLTVLESIDVTENISAFMKISLLAGVILALPVIVYEVLAFILPGLNPNERMWVWIMIPLASLFFIGGVLFAYFYMLPTALPFLLEFMGITTAPRPSNYFGFILNLMFWVGISFELPLIIFLLARLGILTAKQLAQQWRIAIVVIAVASALITPTPDPVNMSLMMLPLTILYLISILFAFIAGRRRRKAQESSESETATS